MKQLGTTLKEARALLNLTLRNVEHATGISNPYLSQLENNKIKHPSANVLFKLATLYKISLSDLVEGFGLVMDLGNPAKCILNTKALLDENMTPDEELILLKYLKFIRS